MARDRDYNDILSEVRGKKVHIWTCNTCARFCNGIGGKDAAQRLASKLSEDGIEVTGVSSTSAACFEAKVSEKKEEVLKNSPEVIISLTCSAGHLNAERIFGRSLNPIITYGFGYLSENGTPVLMSEKGDIPVQNLSEKVSPFV